VFDMLEPCVFCGQIDWHSVHPTLTRFKYNQPTVFSLLRLPLSRRLFNQRQAPAADWPPPSARNLLLAAANPFGLMSSIIGVIHAAFYILQISVSSAPAYCRYGLLLYYDNHTHTTTFWDFPQRRYF
jgi:hypothetical protein